jgi:hypothetical protein
MGVTGEGAQVFVEKMGSGRKAGRKDSEKRA